MKRRLLAGAVGTVRHATLTACWPRNELYYQRAWAGAIRRNDEWVLDSPANNALAHYLHLALYLLGETMTSCAAPAKVEAELYRVNPIENYDTCSLRITMGNGVTLTVLLTHAAALYDHPKIVVAGTRGNFLYDLAAQHAVLPGGEHVGLTSSTLAETLRGFERLVQEPDTQVPHASLEMARAHALVVSAASDATEVHTIGPEHVAKRFHEGHAMNSVPGLAEAFAGAAARNLMLHESGLAKWSRPAGILELSSYSAFTGQWVEKAHCGR